MQTPSPTPPLDDDLLWQATLYLLEELTPAEASAWEARLATEERACLALVQATRLVATLQSNDLPQCGAERRCDSPASLLADKLAAPQTESPQWVRLATSSRPGRWRLPALGAAAVAVLLLGVGWQLIPEELISIHLGRQPVSPARFTQTTHAETAVANQLVGMWHSTARNATGQPPTPVEADLDDDGDDADFLGRNADGRNADGGNADTGTPPDWLLAAVELQLKSAASAIEGAEIQEGQ